MDAYSKILSDGSVVIDYGKKQPTSDLSSHNDWYEVYGINQGTDINPIPGTYYCIGSGNFIVISNDCVYHYTKDWETTTLIRYPPLSLVWIMREKQSEVNTIDDYITYIRVIEPSDL